MINWDEVDRNDPAAWLTLADKLIGQTQMLVTAAAPDADALRRIQADLQEFVREANMKCPNSAISAARRASDQATAALVAIGIQDLERRNDRLDAIKARMSSAANELRADAALLRLEPVRKALGLATGAAADVKGLLAELQRIRKQDMPDRLTSIADKLDEVAAMLEKSVAE